MEKRSRELLELEHKDPSSSAGFQFSYIFSRFDFYCFLNFLSLFFNGRTEAAFLICGNGRKLQEEKPKPDGKPFTQPTPKSQGFFFLLLL